MGSDPGRGRSRGYGGRLDRPPGWADSLMAGRSRADKEADQDARLKALLLIGSAAALRDPRVARDLHGGWFAVGVVVGAGVRPGVRVGAVSAAMNRVLRPVELDGWRWPAAVEGRRAARVPAVGLLGLVGWPGRAGVEGGARWLSRHRDRWPAVSLARDPRRLADDDGARRVPAARAGHGARAERPRSRAGTTAAAGRPRAAARAIGQRATATATSALAMIALLLIATSFAACATAGLWVIRGMGGASRPSQSACAAARGA